MVGNEEFDYEIYLQRVISFVPECRIPDALREAYRALKPGGTVLCSVLNYDGRSINKYLSVILGFLRKVWKENKSGQNLPWLKLKGKPNLRLFTKGQPTVYWFKESEIISLFKEIGFTVLESKTGEKTPSILYLACKKEN